MNKVYNTQEDIARGFEKFLIENCSNIRKTQTNIIPFILFGMISAESVVPLDIAKALKGKFCNIQLPSIIKRINRLLNNDLFEPYVLYNDVIISVINNFNLKHSDKRVHIIFDHMFSHENYTVFMITMRIGKQGIPLYFKCFKGVSDNEAFNEQTLIDGISHVSNLFKDTDFELIFLADRWFNNINILKHIDDLGHTYCIRLKSNIHVYYHNKKEGHVIRKNAGDLNHYVHHSVKYEGILLSDEKYKTNLVISDSVNVNDAWIIVTNGNPNRAIKDYSYRFGGVECVFKNQKSNGFNLEKISNASIKAFTSMYTLTCICVLYLTILGADYSKNTKCYKNEKLKTHNVYNKNGKRIKKRVMSLFNVGLTLFKRAFNSSRYIRLPFSFILYDI